MMSNDDLKDPSQHDEEIVIILLQAVILKVSLFILSSFTVIFLRFDRLRIKYNSQILACKQKQRCG